MKETIDKLKEVIRTLESVHGPFLIFALFLRESPLEKWDVIVSATWLNSSERESYKIIISELQGALSETEFLELSRVVILDADKPVVSFLLGLETITNGGYKELSAQDLSEKFNFTIKRAYLLRSQPANAIS